MPRDRRSPRPYVVYRHYTREVESIVETLLPRPVEPWYIRTRRGALYRAVPPFRRAYLEDPTAWIEGKGIVADRCADTVYLRPGSAEWRTAGAAKKLA